MNAHSGRSAQRARSKHSGAAQVGSRAAASAPPPSAPVRPGYEALGVQGYYQAHAEDYRNPHEPQLLRLLAWWVETFQIPQETRILDLACGSGEVTLGLRTLGRTHTEGLDPYTHVAYTRRTGSPCKTCSFEQLTAEVLTQPMHEAHPYGAVVCSFALHLLDVSRLPGLIRALACLAPMLVVVTPHKRPTLKAEWGAEPLAEMQIERVRARVYRLNPS